jgi:hypothetical protein
LTETLIQLKNIAAGIKEYHCYTSAAIRWSAGHVAALTLRVIYPRMQCRTQFYCRVCCGLLDNMDDCSQHILKLCMDCVSTNLPNAGKGLFAVRHFRAGSLVVPYMGRCMNDPMLMHGGTLPGTWWENVGLPAPPEDAEG